MKHSQTTLLNSITLSVSLPRADAEAVEKFRVVNNVSSLSAALRRLIEAGLAAASERDAAGHNAGRPMETAFGDRGAPSEAAL